MGEQLGVRAGETLCHITYLEMSCSLVCMPISQAHTPTDAKKHKHMPATSTARLAWFSVLLENAKHPGPF